MPLNLIYTNADILMNTIIIFVSMSYNSFDLFHKGLSLGVGWVGGGGLTPSFFSRQFSRNTFPLKT